MTIIAIRISSITRSFMNGPQIRAPFLRASKLLKSPTLQHSSAKGKGKSLQSGSGRGQLGVLAVRQLIGRAAARRRNATLAVGWERANAPGAALRPFLTRADRNGSNNGRGGHEHEKSDGDEQIVHGADLPIQFGLSAVQSMETTEAEKSIGSNCSNSLWLLILQILRKEWRDFGRTIRSKGLQRKSEWKNRSGLAWSEIDCGQSAGRSRKATADPSTPLGAKNAPNCAQDDSFLIALRMTVSLCSKQLPFA
jgi:hypothetical protein